MQDIPDVIKVSRPPYIDEKTRKHMDWKEKDLVVLLREKKRTKSQIKRRLYIKTDSGYWKLKVRVSSKIKQGYEANKSV